MELIKYICFVMVGLSIVSTNIAQADQSYYALPGQVKIAALDPTEEWVKLDNTGDTAVDLAGWVFYDDDDSHEFFITPLDVVGSESREYLLLDPGGEVTINVKNDSDFRLKQSGEELRLYSGPLEMEGVLQDEVTYPEIKGGESYVIISNFQDPRLPDGQVTTNENPIADSYSGGLSEGFANDNSGEQKQPDNLSEELASQILLLGKSLTVNEDIQYRVPEEDNVQAYLNIETESGGAKKADGREEENKNDGSRENSGTGILLSEVRAALVKQNKLISENMQGGADTFLESPNDISNIGNNVIPLANNISSDKNGQEQPYFTASSEMEKSPYVWFYRLWNNWFLWRIILPFLGLWAGLYWAVLFVKKKYL